ncbi:efflux transporter outer membrane subunit [Phenylobacterium immobile]|uniref:efflux transporter outer membrane subunit n=1 Tax=Phenylobacterium immobile TaxID=21 RepID=UPI000AD8CD63|nr:TolC family protein [Phenylobacterium immobile]
MPRVLPALLAVLMVSGCATRPADTRLPLAFEAPAGAPAADVAVLDRWWEAYGDPQLTGLIDQALIANPDVRSATARLREVSALRQSALFSFLPQGDATGSARRVRTEQLDGTAVSIPGFNTSGVAENYAANFNVSWEVDLFGRIFAADRAAKGDLAAARFNLEGARAAIAAQTASAYFQARGLAIQLGDARETERIQSALYTVVSRRAQIGIVATSEADRVAGDLAQAKAQVQGLEADLQVQRRAILILAGRIVEPTANIAVTPVVGVIPQVPLVLPSDLLMRRPDVREAEAGVASAAGRRDVAGLALLPTITFTPGVGWSRVEQPGFFTESQSWTLAGNVLQPVLSIPRLLADLKAEKARTEQALIAYEKTVQTAFSEAESSLVRLDADRRRVALLTEGEARAGRAYRASKLGYDRGLTDLQTTLDAERAWRAARTALTSSQVQALQRSVQAFQAVGGGWPASSYAPPKLATIKTPTSAQNQAR